MKSSKLFAHLESDGEIMLNRMEKRFNKKSINAPEIVNVFLHPDEYKIIPKPKEGK